MNGLVLDVSALLACCSGDSVEPGAMIALAGEDPDQHVWIPALCLAEATRRLIGSKHSAVLEVLTGPNGGAQVAFLDGATSRRVARIAAEHDLSLDAAHAIATALLYRCYLVTSAPEVAGKSGRLGLETLDVTETWD